MGRYEKLNREQLEKLVELFLNMCLHYTGAQYTESILRAGGLGDAELKALGFDIDGWQDETDAGTEA